MAEFVSYGHILLFSKRTNKRFYSFINKYFCTILEMVNYGSWNLQLKIRVIIFVCCTGTKPKYGPHFHQTQKVIRNLSFANTPSLLECPVPATNGYLAGWLWVQNACCIVVTGFFLATCSIHQHIFCGAFRGGSMQQRSLVSYETKFRGFLYQPT